MSDLQTKSGFSGIEQVQFQDNPAATRALQQINQFLLGVFGGQGTQGNRVLTQSDAVALGLASFTSGGSSSSLPPGLEPGNIGSSSSDPTIPPAPTSLSAFAGLASAILTWDAVSLSYFDHTEVWRSIANNLATAIYVGETQAPLYADYPGAAGITYYYWIRHVSKAGNAGPYNAVSGVSATTGRVQNGDIQNGAVDSLKIANAAIVEALIGNLAVTTAKIGNLAVTDAKVVSMAVGKLIAGAIATGQYISSTNYSPNTSGYIIDYTGYAEFQNIKARGDIQASSIVASVSILAPSISGGSFTGGSFTGNTFDGGTFIAGSLRSNISMSSYTTPAGSRVGSVSGYTYEMYLGATGTALQEHVNGRWRRYADGRMEVDQLIFSRPNVLFQGSITGAGIQWPPPSGPVYFGGGD